MASVDLLTVGEAYEDLVFGELDRLPRLGEEIRTASLVRGPGGGVVITAIAAARLGLRCTILSGLPKDARAVLEREGLRVKSVLRAGEAHGVTIALSTRKDRCFVTYGGADETVEERLLELAPQMEARHVHFAMSPRRCSRWAPVLGMLRRRGTTTSWDFGHSERIAFDKAFTTLARAVDLLFLNETEALLYSGARSIGAAAAHFRASTRGAVIKLGEKGARWVTRHHDLTMPAPRVATIDTTGAGDAFDGGFLQAMLAGLPREACLRRATIVGALSTRAMGGLGALPRTREVLLHERRSEGRRR